MDSWKFIIEVQWTVRAPLVFVRYQACFLEGEVWGDFPGLCKILHKTTLLVWNHMGFPSCIPVFSFEGSGLCWLYFVWKLLVDDGLWWVGSDSSLLVCRDQLRPSFRPWVAVKASGALCPTSPQALRWTISILSSAAFGLEFTGKLEFMD